jgi:hypothetical protein
MMNAKARARMEEKSNRASGKGHVQRAYFASGAVRPVFNAVWWAIVKGKTARGCGQL